MEPATLAGNHVDPLRPALQHRSVRLHERRHLPRKQHDCDLGLGLRVSAAHLLLPRPVAERMRLVRPMEAACDLIEAVAHTSLGIDIGADTVQVS